MSSSKKLTRQFKIGTSAGTSEHGNPSRKTNRRPVRHQFSVDDTPGAELHLLVDWWEEDGKGADREKAVKWLKEQLDEISLNSELIQNALKFTNDLEQTALHLAILHRMPEEFIANVVLKMEKHHLDRQDVNGCKAIDYLLDWPKINDKVLQAFMDQNADFTGGKTSPAIRLCRRPTDGHKLMKLLCEHGSKELLKVIANRMLEEAIKRGSSTTVELLLETFETDPGAYGKLLFHAAEANHESVEKVKLLLDRLPEQCSQQNKAGRTLIHIAAGGKPPRLELLKLALKENIDPNLQDHKGDTALHMVTKNYAEQKNPWVTSRMAMQLLLKHGGIDVNKKNAKGKTPLHNLMVSRDLPPQLLLLWQTKKAQFVDPNAKEEDLLHSPLADLCKRRDGPQLFKYLSTQLDLDSSMDTIKYLLQAAVLDGTAEMVKVLLDRGANANEWSGLLLMMATSSKIDMAMKIKYLHDKKAKYTYSDARGYSVLHAVANSEAATKDAIRVCTHASCLGLELEGKDRYSNTPLHIAAMSKKDGSDVLVGCLADKEQGGNPNAMNRDKKTAFRLVLKHNYDRKELRRNKLMVLLERGCLPTRRDFEEYKGNADDFQNLFLSSELVARSRNPIQLLLVLGWYCQNPLPDVWPSLPSQSSVKLEETSDWARTVKWKDLSAKSEEEAVMIINEFGKKERILRGVMTNTDIQEVRVQMKWEKFLANEYVGKMLNQMFYGRVDALTAEERPEEMDPREMKTWYLLPIYTMIFLLQCLLLPLHIPDFSCERDKSDKNKSKEYTGNKEETERKATSKWCVNILPSKVFAPPDPKRRPAVTVFGYFVSYLLFLVFVIAHIVKEDIEKTFTWNEWIIMVYVISMSLDEINQVCSFGLKKYVTFTNIVDDCKILCYIVFLILRGIGTANDDLTMLRVAEHIFALAAMMSCLRLLYYLQVNRRLGPILISITEMIAEVLLFIVILGVILFAFALAISGVYGAGVYTTEFKNDSISLPPPARGVWRSVQTLYWSLFGQLNLEELNSEYDVLSPESVIGLILVAIWLLASVIVLLSMLIALINEAFDRVKKQNADLVWNLAVSRVIEEVKFSPSLPLPMNIFYLSSVCVTFLCRKWIPKCQRPVCHDTSVSEPNKSKYVDEDRPLFEMPNVKRILEAYQIAKRKRERSEGNGLAQENLEEIKDIQSHTQMSLFKQMKRIDRRMRLLQARDIDVNYEDEIGRQMSIDRNYILNCLANDADSDGEDEGHSKPKIRRRGVACLDHEQLVTVSYANDGMSGDVGGCLFLCAPISLDNCYFEVLVDGYGLDGSIGIGLAHHEYPINQMPGNLEDSIAYRCDSGRCFFNGKVFYKKEVNRENAEDDQELTTPAQQGDVVGCGVKISPGRTDIEENPIVFFTRNGEEMASVRVKLPKGGFFPTVGLCSEGAKVTVNLRTNWKSPDDDVDEEPSDMLLSGSMLRRIRDDCLFYDNRDRRLCYTSGLSQIQENVGVFQDLSHPISRQLSYFEVKLLDMGVRGEIGIGVAHLQHPLHRMPGRSKGSTAYHCNDGAVFKGLLNKSIFSCAERGDVIGCGVKVSDTNSKRAKVFFTRNQILLEDFEMVLPEDGFYPTIGMSSAGEEVQINFDVKWPPQSARTFVERIHTVGNVVEYVGDRFRRVGAYQSLASPMSRTFSYYEVTIQDFGKEGRIGVGLARKDYPLNKQPGWLDGSIAWNCNDGDVFKDGKKLGTFLSPAKEGDVVGCGVDYKESQKRMNTKLRVARNSETELVVYFSLNGKRSDNFSVTEPTDGLYPIVGLQTPGERVEINMSPLAALQRSTQDENSITLPSRLARVRIDRERGCMSYVVTPCDFVGVLQYPTNMEVVGRYFEVLIVSPGDKRQIGIGFATKNFPLDHQPGWVKGSVGFLCDEGYRYRDGELITELKYELPQVNDIIGCRIEDDNTVIFTHNGKEIGKPVKLDERYEPSQLFPTIGLHSRGEAVKVNLDAIWQRRDMGEFVFARSERVRTEDQTVSYNSLDDTKIGAVQLKREVNKEQPYFEVQVEDDGIDHAIGIGLAPSYYPLTCLPGWRPGSIGYHCQDGCVFEGRELGRPIGDPVKNGDKVGCGIDYQQSTRQNAVVYFTHNRKKLNDVFKLEWAKTDSDDGKVLYPTIGLSSKGEKVKLVENAQVDPSWWGNEPGIVLTSIRSLHHQI